MKPNNLNVYITTYNRADMLRNSIQSVLNQSFKQFDLYVLDNCSTDHTKDVVESFSDSRIHYICHEENIGGIANINYAFMHNTKKYFVVFHDDDRMEKDFLQIEYDFLEMHEDIAAVSCKERDVDEDGNVLSVGGKDDGSVEIFSENHLFERYIVERHFLIFPTIMYRSSFMKKHNILLDKNVGPSCDVKSYFDIERFGGKVATIDKVLISSGVHKNRDSSINALDMFRRLMVYIKNDEYYSAMYSKFEGIEATYARKIFFDQACALTNSIGDVNKVSDNVNKYIQDMDVYTFDKIWIRMFLLLYKMCPGLIRMVYKLGKNIKRKRMIS